MGESYRTTIAAIIPLVAGLALTIIGAWKGDTTLMLTGIGLLGGGGIGVYARDQQAHANSQPPKV